MAQRPLRATLLGHASGEAINELLAVEVLSNEDELVDALVVAPRRRRHAVKEHVNSFRLEIRVDKDIKRYNFTKKRSLSEGTR